MIVQQNPDHHVTVCNRLAGRQKSWNATIIIVFKTAGIGGHRLTAQY